MNFVGNNIFLLVASAVFLPCNNSGAWNSSLSHKALESIHSSTCCSRTSFQVHWIPPVNSWALLHFIFLIMLSVYYFLTMVRVKFIPFRGSTVTEPEMLVKKEQCTSFSWAFCFCQRGQVFRNAKHNLSCKLSLSEGPSSRNSQLTLDFENKNQPLAQCSWILHIWYQKLDTWY